MISANRRKHRGKQNKQKYKPQTDKETVQRKKKVKSTMCEISVKRKELLEPKVKFYSKSKSRRHVKALRMKKSLKKIKKL